LCNADTLHWLLVLAQVLSPNSGSVLSPTGGRLLFRFSPGPTRLTPAEQP
jgi:hypothetical protein